MVAVTAYALGSPLFVSSRKIRTAYEIKRRDFVHRFSPNCHLYNHIYSTFWPVIIGSTSLPPHRPTMNGHVNSQGGPQTTSYDIIVVGAGISGINAAYRIQTTLPNST